MGHDDPDGFLCRQQVYLLSMFILLLLRKLLFISAIISGAVAIDTSQCEMTFLGTPHKKLGILTTKPVLIDCDLWNQTICTFTFDTTVKFNSTAAFIFTGENALRIVAELGDIIVETKIDVTGNSAAHKTVLGGYLNYAGNNPGLYFYLYFNI